jgi:hypothetical protein
MYKTLLPILFFLIFFSQDLTAAEFRSHTQVVTIKRPGKDTVGKQQDIFAKAQVNRRFSLGVDGTYLERFGLFDKRTGLVLGSKPNDKWSFEVGYRRGNGNDILPESEVLLQSYFAWKDGLTPFFLFRDAKYSLTHLHALNVGMEIEKIPQLIFIPMLLAGKANFKEPATTRDVYSYGVRITYYSELKYAFTIFGNMGKEASQGIVGRSTRMVDTRSGGLTLTYYILPELKTEATFDHTNFDQLRTQFQTTMLTLTWML